MGNFKVKIISYGAHSLTEKVVYLRMLIEKIKLLDIRMTDYVKQQLRENEDSPDFKQEEERIRNLQPNIQIESDLSENEKSEENEESEEIEIEFEDEDEEEGEEDDYSKPYVEKKTNKMDFGSKFKNKEEDDTENKIDM